MNGFLFPDPVLCFFPSEAEETLLIDIASNSEYHSEWNLLSFNIYLIEYPLRPLLGHVLILPFYPVFFIFLRQPYKLSLPPKNF